MHIMNLQSSFTYDNFGRRTSRTLQMDNTTVSTAGRSYDTFGRIASISNGTDTLSYTYRPGGQLSLSGWTNGQNTAMSNQSYEYDQYNRLTGIKLNNVNEVSYTLNTKDQRTTATYANAGLWNFTAALLEAGANVNAVNNDGETPLDWAQDGWTPAHTRQFRKALKQMVALSGKEL